MPRAGLDSETVTEAAAVIVDAEGPAALTLSRLAADLGVAPPSLYKHVAGLDDLIHRVATLSIRRLTNNLTAAALGRSGRQALLAIAEAYRSFATEHAGLYSLTQAAPKPGSTAQQAEASRAVEVLGAAIRSYGVPDDLSIHAVRMVRAGLHGFADIEARGGFRMPHSVDESFLVLVNALDASLSNLGRRTGNQQQWLA
jgi:AcrR family transcriptional regulator